MKTPRIVSNSKAVSLPFYKKWLEQMLSRNPCFVGDLMLRMGKDNACFPPDYVKIETTNACNGRCVYCPRDKMSRRIGIMDFGLFSQIISELSLWGVAAVHLQNYGEPLMDPLIAKRVKYAKDKGIRHVNLFTNGMLLTEEAIGELMAAGLDEINISLDSCDKETHDKMRRNLSYDVIVSNIKTLIGLRKVKNITKPKITLASIIHREDNLATVDFINYWNKLVEEIHFQEAHDWATRELQKESHKFPCFRLWSTFTILWDGCVSVCCVDYDGRYILGNVKSTPVRQIWNNNEYARMRRLHLKAAGPQIDLCRNCTLRLKDSPLWIKRLMFLKNSPAKEDND